MQLRLHHRTFANFGRDVTHLDGLSGRFFTAASAGRDEGQTCGDRKAREIA